MRTPVLLDLPREAEGPAPACSIGFFNECDLRMDVWREAARQHYYVANKNPTSTETKQPDKAGQLQVWSSGSEGAEGKQQYVVVHMLPFLAISTVTRSCPMISWGKAFMYFRL